MDLDDPKRYDSHLGGAYVMGYWQWVGQTRDDRHHLIDWDWTWGPTHYPRLAFCRRSWTE
jgi:hypothetical protein